MTRIDQILFLRLRDNGIEPTLIPGFIRSLANALLINPRMTHMQANTRLKYLGWNNIEIYYHTFILAKTSLEFKGLKALEYRSAPWYKDSFKSCDLKSMC